MRLDTLTLPLFAVDLLPTSPTPTAQSLPAHWPPAKRENFTWWCQVGNQEMCAAVLWQSGHLTPVDAKVLVKALHDLPPALLTHESPDCAHFASPMEAQPRATA